MKLKLLKDVSGVGHSDQLVEVSDAQARNFLLPKKMAVIATGAVLAAHEQTAINEKRQQARRVGEVAALMERLLSATVHLSGKANSQGKLFAAIKSSDIQAALEQQYSINLPHLTCQPDHLKTVGSHQVEILIDHDHRATVTILIEHGS